MDMNKIYKYNYKAHYLAYIFVCVFNEKSIIYKRKKVRGGIPEFLWTLKTYLLLEFRIIFIVVLCAIWRVSFTA